jgi:protein TonB
MLLIIAAHVALIAAVMSAKMEIQRHRPPGPTTLISIPLPTEPPPHPLIVRRPPPPNSRSFIDHANKIIETIPSDSQPRVDAGSTIYDPGLVAGAGSVAATENVQPVLKPPAPTGARLLTPTSELKPPYPASKLINEEEAVLTLMLNIDANGRVTSVDPVGHADSVFLEAARRYLIAHWRYAPATEEGHAVASTTIVTLHFELNG